MKVFVVVLVIVAALFAATFFLGSGEDGVPSRDGRRAAADREPGAFERTLGKLSKPFRPKVDVGVREFRLDGKPFQVPRADVPFRALSVKVTGGCSCEVVYDSPLSKREQDLNPQKVTLPDQGRSKTVLTLLKEGGTLTFGPCRNPKHPQGSCKAPVVDE